MNMKVFVPSGISALRIVALPIFLYFFSIGAAIWCIVVFGLTQITDLIDGYVARKWGVASKSGAYFDALTDFIFITGIFVAFTLSGYYHSWMLLLIGASFAQFVLSSFCSKKIYDPLGKYIGSVLYIAIGLTLLSPTPVIFTIVEVGFPIWALLSFVTRIASFTSNHRKKLITQKTNLKKHLPQPHN